MARASCAQNRVTRVRASCARSRATVGLRAEPRDHCVGELSHEPCDHQEGELHATRVGAGVPRAELKHSEWPQRLRSVLRDFPDQAARCDLELGKWIGWVSSPSDRCARRPACTLPLPGPRSVLLALRRRDASLSETELGAVLDYTTVSIAPCAGHSRQARLGRRRLRSAPCR
jgi:hypothetical protein